MNPKLALGQLQRTSRLGPPVERLERYHFCCLSVVYFSRGNLPKKVGERALLKDLVAAGHGGAKGPTECTGHFERGVLENLFSFYPRCPDLSLALFS